jgi:hypothetical protein
VRGRRQMKECSRMLNMVKKALNWAKDFYKSATAVRKETPKFEAPEHKVSVTGPSYWAEFIEQQKILRAAEEYNLRQEKLAAQTTDDALYSWRENNTAVDKYFARKNKRLARERRLRLVTA